MSYNSWGRVASIATTTRYWFISCHLSILCACVLCVGFDLYNYKMLQMSILVICYVCVCILTCLVCRNQCSKNTFAPCLWCYWNRKVLDFMFTVNCSISEMDTNCPDNCHGNGECRDRQCRCFPGYTGWDCSQSKSLIYVNMSGWLYASCAWKSRSYISL